MQGTGKSQAKGDAEGEPRFAHALLNRMCGADGMVNRTLCFDRLDLPDPHNKIPQYKPDALTAACGNVGFVGSNPVMFKGPEAARCVNQSASSVLQHMDEARDGYMDPRAYKRKSRHIAPLRATSAHHARRTEVISGVTLNQAPHVELNAVQNAGARGEGPIILPRGRVVGARPEEFGPVAGAAYAGLAAAAM